MRALSILKSFAVWRIAIPALIPAAFLVSSASRYLSEDGGSVPRFEREVLPILQANCVTCHGEKLKKNGLDLRTLDSLLKGGESGPAVTPGSAKDSLLFRKISAGEMPFRGTKLSQEKIDLIGRWIQAGALREGEDVDASRKQLTAAQDRLKVPHFESEVLPIFQENCLVCHGETMKQKGLDLRTRQTALKGGESGPAIVQGAAKDSLLFQKILSGVMPPGDKKLSAEKVELLRRWIDSGALKLGEEAQASKGPAPKPVTEQEVMVNVFEARCITCHGKWQRDGGLDLRTRASL